MVKIQIDLSDDEDRIVDVYKLSNRLKTKQDAITSMVKYFRVKIVPKNMDEKEYFYKNALANLGDKK